MYLKDQTKRVQYTFRIKEELMEDLKAYSNNKGVKIPSILNEIIEDYLANIVVNNTWLRDQPGTFITIPKEIPKHTTTIQLTEDMDGMQYEVKKIPNNLDIWHDKYGFMSKENGIKHEGLEPLIITDLIKDKNLYPTLEGKEELSKCLCAIYFRVLDNNKMEMFLVDSKEAIGLALQINMELASMITNYRNIVNGHIHDALEHLHLDNETLIKRQLLEDMEAAAQKINTGNIVPIGMKQHSAIIWDNVIFDDPKSVEGNNLEELQKNVDALTNELKKTQNINAKIIEWLLLNADYINANPEAPGNSIPELLEEIKDMQQNEYEMQNNDQ